MNKNKQLCVILLIIETKYRKKSLHNYDVSDSVKYMKCHKNAILLGNS